MFKSSVSQKELPINCIPIGSPSLENPEGIEMAGSPDKFTGIVKRSPLYNSVGSSRLLLSNDNAVVGVVGPRIISISLKASSKSLFITDRTLWACS